MGSSSKDLKWNVTQYKKSSSQEQGERHKNKERGQFSHGPRKGMVTRRNCKPFF